MHTKLILFFFLEPNKEISTGSPVSFFNFFIFYPVCVLSTIIFFYYLILNKRLSLKEGSIGKYLVNN